MRETGKIDYVEIPCRDLQATKAFFMAAFQWRFQFTDPSGNEFAVWSDQGL